MGPEFVVRPFRQIVELGSIERGLEISGTIEGSSLVVSVDGTSHTIATRRVGEDSEGQYAVVAKLDEALGRGYRLEVDVDVPEAFDPDSALGCMIRVSFPAGSSVTIYFTPTGHVDGEGSASIMSRPAAPPTKH